MFGYSSVHSENLGMFFMFEHDGVCLDTLVHVRMQPGVMMSIARSGGDARVQIPAGQWRQRVWVPGHK